ncbi:MAG: AEC family transporter [Pseudomonadota bacterium]
MADLLNLTLPFFAVIALGFFAGRRNWVPVAAVPAINTFVFYFAMPALVAGSLARQDIASLLDLGLLTGWLGAALILFTLGMLFARLRDKAASLGQMAISGQAASVANVGFLALPITAANFGDDGVRLSATVLIVDLLIIIPLSITLLEARSGGSGLQTFVTALSRAIRNPFAIAILLGVALSATGIGLPGPTERFADFLGAAGAPTALFALGLSLATRQTEGDGSFVAGITILKLVAHPLVVFLALMAIGTDLLITAIATVIAATPVAQNVFVIATQYETYSRRIGTAILVSTLCAVVTVTAVLWLVR